MEKKTLPPKKEYTAPLTYMLPGSFFQRLLQKIDSHRFYTMQENRRVNKKAKYKTNTAFFLTYMIPVNAHQQKAIFTRHY